MQCGKTSLHRADFPPPSTAVSPTQMVQLVHLQRQLAEQKTRITVFICPRHAFNLIVCFLYLYIYNSENHYYIKKTFLGILNVYNRQLGIQLRSYIQSIQKLVYKYIKLYCKNSEFSENLCLFFDYIQYLQFKVLTSSLSVFQW